jgi:hypothetical protein
MGKRKASALEETAIYPDRATTSPSVSSTSFSPSSTTSNDGMGHNFWNLDAVPYLTCRTRKRHRDGRPDEEVVHENTIKKLYDAQRLHLDEAVPMSEVVGMDEEEQTLQDDVMIDAVAAELPRSIQSNQRTIEAFFGGK